MEESKCPLDKFQKRITKDEISGASLDDVYVVPSLWHFYKLTS
jgi:hypothetical protein